MCLCAYSCTMEKQLKTSRVGKNMFSLCFIAWRNSSASGILPVPFAFMTSPKICKHRGLDTVALLTGYKPDFQERCHPKGQHQYGTVPWQKAACYPSQSKLWLEDSYTWAMERDERERGITQKATQKQGGLFYSAPVWWAATLKCSLCCFWTTQYMNWNFPRNQIWCPLSVSKTCDTKHGKALPMHCDQ